MHNNTRQLRRSARLLFPKTTLDPSVIDQIVEEGFCDVCVTFVEMEQMFTDQGFNLEQAEQLAQMAQERSNPDCLCVLYEIPAPAIGKRTTTSHVGL